MQTGGRFLLPAPPEKAKTAIQFAFFALKRRKENDFRPATPATPNALGGHRAAATAFADKRLHTDKQRACCARF
jgi:hypothetical protein